MAEGIGPDDLKKMKEIVPPLWIQISAVLSFLWSIVHVINSRTATDILTYSMSTAVASLVVFALLGAFLWLTERPIFSLTNFSLAGGLLIVSCLVFFATIYGLLLYAVGASLEDLYFWIQAGLGELRGIKSWSAAPTDVQAMVVVLVTVVPLFVGTFFFYFRLSFRSLYGVTEAVAGILVAIFKVFGSPPDELATGANFMLGMLTGSIYLVVRGFDNVHQAFQEPLKDPLIIAARTWIYKKSVNPSEAFMPSSHK